MIVPPINPYATAIAGTAQAQAKDIAPQRPAQAVTARPTLPAESKYGPRARDKREREPAGKRRGSQHDTVV